MYRVYYNAGVRPTADVTKKCRLSALHNDGLKVALRKSTRDAHQYDPRKSERKPMSASGSTSATSHDVRAEPAMLR